MQNATPAPLAPVEIPARERMTFEQFRATGKDYEDLRQQEVCELSHQDLPNPVPGRLYADTNAFIERAPGMDGEWYCEWGSSFIQGSLEMAEGLLYRFYLSEIAHEHVRDYLEDVAPEVENWHKHPDTAEDLGKILAGFFRIHELPFRSPEAIVADPQGLPEDKVQWLRQWIARCEALTAPPADADLDVHAAAVRLSPLEQIRANVKAYNDELNRLEIAPNGDDYNALLDLIGGGRLELPRAGGR